MGAKTNLALVQVVQVVAVALVIGVAYASTLELLKQKKIDLHDIELKKKTAKYKKLNIPMNGNPSQRQQSNPRR